MLTLGTQDPPETATLTLTVQNTSRVVLGTLNYRLTITDLNDPPALTVLLDDPVRVNVDEVVAATVVATADPIETGQAMELLSTVVGMVTVDGIGLPRESIGDLLTDYSFTLGGAVGRAREVVFQATPRFTNTGSVRFEVSARDSERAVSSAAAFTLIVGSVSGVDLLRITPSTRTIATDEAALQRGVPIDPGVAVTSVEKVGTVRVMVRRGVNGDLAGAALEPASGAVGDYLLAPLSMEDDIVGWEYTQPGGGGTAAMNAQSLLQSLTLMLGTEDPPETATVTVTVQNDTGEAMDDSVDYRIMIVVDNDPPVLGAVENISIGEDSGAFASTAVATADPVEAGQAIDPAVAFEVMELTVRGDGGGSSIGDLLSSHSFSLDGDGTTVLFTATPVADRYGTAVFTVTVSDTGTPAASSAFAFTLAVEAMNDTPVITVAEDSTSLRLFGGERRGVVAELSDVDVSMADGNRDRFTQSGDSMVFRLPESVTDVALRLRDGLVSGEQVSLTSGGPSVARVQGDGGVLTTLTFTAGLTADQVEDLIEAVEVSADLTAMDGSYRLSITLTTDFNDGVVRQQEDRRPLTATAMVEVNVVARTILMVSFDPPAIALPADRERAVRLSVDPAPINSEMITVTLDVESETPNAVSLPVSTVVFDSDQSATEVVVRVAAGIERNTTARVTIDATGVNAQVAAGNSLLVRVVSGVLLRIRTFLEGALQ